MAMLHRIKNLSLIAAFGISSLAAQLGSAQEMSQGEARITASNEVKLELKNGAGLSSQQMLDVGGAITQELGEIRKCYRKVTEKDPAIQGQISATIKLKDSGKTIVRERSDTTSSDPLKRCVLRTLRRTDYSMVNAIGQASISLHFKNSAAEGVAEMRARTKEEGAVEVNENEAGKYHAEGGTPDGLIKFSLVGLGKTPQDVVAESGRAMRTAMPYFLDCRRKATRGERSAVGEIKTVVSLLGKKKKIKGINTSVEHPGALKCAERVLRRAPFPKKVWGRIRITINYAARDGELGSK